MGLLPCPNLPLWAAEKSFSSSDENHFPPPEKKKGLSLLQSPFPSKSPTNYAAVQARLATGHCCGSCSLGGNTCAKISATWTRCSKGLLRHDAVTTLDNFPNTRRLLLFFLTPRARECCGHRYSSRKWNRCCLCLRRLRRHPQRSEAPVLRKRFVFFWDYRAQTFLHPPVLQRWAGWIEG